MEDRATYSRRRFIEAASTAAAATIIGLPATPLLAQTGTLRETADLITGPFYPRTKPADSDADLTRLRGRTGRAEGQVVQLTGRVLTLRGDPVRDALVEIWQANAAGRYSHPSDPNTGRALDSHFQGYAALRTDRGGNYRFTTVKPGAYPTPRGDMRAPHIHFQIDGAIDRKVTQLFFPGEPLNEQDRHLKSVRRPETLIAAITPATDGSALLAQWDIVLTSG